MFCCFLLITSCDSVPQLLPQFDNTQPQPETLVMVTFRVRLPEPLSAGETIYLAEVDEVTGIGFNPVLHAMEAENSQDFILLLPVEQYSFLKYRYIRKGEYSALEFTPFGQPVRYRVYHAKEPGIVNDVVFKWMDTSPRANYGRIIGKAVRADNNQPISNLIITAGGLQTLTLADGTFVLEGLPEGTHHLVAFAQDGMFEVFQQGAVVQVGAATEALISMTPSRMVNVTFHLQAPAQTPPGAPIRIAGNLIQLGNSFANLRGGTSNSAVRLPSMERLSDGTYQATLSLPVGGDIRYKYTLGDGIWNTEYTESPNLYRRQLIVPDSDVEITDQVMRWRDTDQRFISFDVTVPETTPKDEIIAIQFNPGYTWMEPIPMWLVEPNRWIYILYSPLRGLDNLHYRYCRDMQCGIADDAKTVGNLSEGREIRLDQQPQLVQDRVEAWHWLDESTTPAVVPNLEVAQRGEDFIAGIAFLDFYHPLWYFRIQKSTLEVRNLNANWIILQPTQSYSHREIPFQDAVPGMDMPGADLAGLLTYLNSQNFKTAIFPISHYPNSKDRWWYESPRDFAWWVSWFSYYQTFIRHYAQLANDVGASSLILGDPNLSPAFPEGKLFDGSSSQNPEDSAARWENIIQEARNHFNGPIWWAVEFPQGDNPGESGLDLPPFIDLVDHIYVLWSPPISDDAEADAESMTQKSAAHLDSILLPLYQKTKKPIILALRYPSARGATTGCLPGTEESCLDFSLLNRPSPDVQIIARDLKEQENAYNAVFTAVSSRDWISGVVSDGFYFPVPLQDKSTSIHGKPASGVLWYWFGKLRGVLP
jgi:hypothetical protein